MASSSTNSSNNPNDGNKQPNEVSNDKETGSSEISSVPPETIVQQHTTCIKHYPEGNKQDEVLFDRTEMYRFESSAAAPVQMRQARAYVDDITRYEEQGLSDMVMRARPFEEIRMPDTKSDGSTTKPPGSK